MANSVDPDQTAPIGAVCSGSMLFDSILNSSVMLGNYLQQTTSADDIFRCIFLGALRVKLGPIVQEEKLSKDFSSKILSLALLAILLGGPKPNVQFDRGHYGEHSCDINLNLEQ